MQRTVGPHDLLTPAEHAALHQVLASGQQTLLLSVLGSAIGGTVHLTNELSETVHNLLVPEGVTAVHDFAKNPAINLAGNLVNAGNFFAVASSGSVSTANITALNIVNQQSAVLSSVLLEAGIAGVASAVSALSMNLQAVQDIINEGVIKSSGSLALTAGGSIVNAGSSGASGVRPAIAAVHDLSLMSGTGSFVNQGLISSLQGNINISSTIAQNISISNGRGIMQALAGAIGVRDASFTGLANLSIIGGDIRARELNVFSGKGVVDIDVRELTATVNVVANDAHISAATETLQLGSLELGGDPTFYNAGNIVINQPLVFPGASNTDHDLAIIASGNITTGDNAGAIDTSSTSFNGGQILIVAGANFTKSPTGAPPSALPEGGGTGDTTTTINITGASATGGKIDLTTGANGGISALTSTSSAGRGGNVSLVAFKGSAVDSGTIRLPQSVAITTGGAGANANGDVNFLAAATSGTPISVGPIDTTGGTGGGGSIYVGYANVGIAGGGTCAPCVAVRNGTVTAGAFVINKLPDFDTNPINDPLRSVATGSWTVRSPTGMTIVTYGDLLLGSVQTNGANLAIVSARKMLTSSQTGAIDTSSTTGKGGHLALVAGANIVPSTTLPPAPSAVIQNFTISRGSGKSGILDLATGTPLTALTTSSSAPADPTTGVGKPAGNITIAAFDGAARGNIKLPRSLTIMAHGGPGAAGSIVRVFAPVVDIGAIEALTVGGNTASGTPNRVDVQAGHPCCNVDVVQGNLTSTFNPDFNASSQGLRTGSLTVNGPGNNIKVASGSGTTAPFVDGNITAGGGGTVTITVNATTEFRVGPGATASGVNGSVTVDGGRLTGNGGLIDIQNFGTGGLNILAPGAISTPAGPEGGSGGTIRLKAPQGRITFAPGTLSVDARPNINNVPGVTGFAGSFDISAASLLVGSGGNLLLSANGARGSGQCVCVTTTSLTADLRFGPGNGEVSVSLAGGDGSLNVFSARDLMVNTAGINTSGRATGTFFTLAAGRNLLITGDLDAGQGVAGMRSNSSSAFVVGGNATVNGITGVIRADGSGSGGQGEFGFGGQISLTNNGTGGIDISSPDRLSMSPSPGGGRGGILTIITRSGPLKVGAG
ncbi:MAG TPA: hypothetical protein V6D08_05225, partial [Candidatus Obscuribacterales bacterium]